MVTMVIFTKSRCGGAQMQNEPQFSKIASMVTAIIFIFAAMLLSFGKSKTKKFIMNQIFLHLAGI